MFYFSDVVCIHCVENSYSKIWALIVDRHHKVTVCSDVYNLFQSMY